MLDRDSRLLVEAYNGVRGQENSKDPDITPSNPPKDWADGFKDPVETITGAKPFSYNGKWFLDVRNFRVNKDVVYSYTTDRFLPSKKLEELMRQSNTKGEASFILDAEEDDEEDEDPLLSKYNKWWLNKIPGVDIKGPDRQV